MFMPITNFASVRRLHTESSESANMWLLTVGISSKLRLGLSLTWPDLTWHSKGYWQRCHNHRSSTASHLVERQFSSCWKISPKVCNPGRMLHGPHPILFGTIICHIQPTLIISHFTFFFFFVNCDCTHNHIWLSRQLQSCADHLFYYSFKGYAW